MLASISALALVLTFSESGWKQISKELADAWENVARRDMTGDQRMFRLAELAQLWRRRCLDLIKKGYWMCDICRLFLPA